MAVLDAVPGIGRGVVRGADDGTRSGAWALHVGVQDLIPVINSRVMHGQAPLRAGEFVLLGSVVKTKRLRAGDDVRVAIQSLGELRLKVE